MELKKDLDEYLLLQSDQKKSFKLTMPNMQTPKLTNWFKKSEPEVEQSWFQEKKSECCPTMSRMQRIIACALCAFMGVMCFSISMMYIPFLLLKARKFALLFTLGSTFFILSLSFLMGPVAYFKYMFSRERLLLTITYGGTLIATLYFALVWQNTPFTVLSAVGQIISLLWTVISNIPGGTSGLSFFGRMFSSTVSNALPI